MKFPNTQARRRRRQGVREASGECIDLRRTVPPRVPDHTNTRLPCIVEHQDGLASVVACLFAVPAQPDVDRQTLRETPRVLYIGAVVEDLRTRIYVRNQGRVVRARRKIVVQVVELSVLVSDVDRLLSREEKEGVGPAIHVVSTHPDFVVPCVQRDVSADTDAGTRRCGRRSPRPDRTRP